jgi:hypothetical protein
MAAAAGAKPGGAQLPSPGKLTLNVNTGSSGSDDTPAESVCVESLGMEASLQVGPRAKRWRWRLLIDAC